MDEIVVGREDCPLCGGEGSLPVLGLDPVRNDGELACECAVQLMWDGRTFWVNAGDGSSVARFGPAGIDIHRTAQQQAEGAHQCLDCRPATMDDVVAKKFGREHRLWSDFERSLREHYGIVIPKGFAR